MDLHDMMVYVSIYHCLPTRGKKTTCSPLRVLLYYTDMPGFSARVRPKKDDIENNHAAAYIRLLAPKNGPKNNF
jgi:hypothetical protein